MSKPSDRQYEYHRGANNAFAHEADGCRKAGLWLVNRRKRNPPLSEHYVRGYKDMLKRLCSRRPGLGTAKRTRR